ERAEVLREKGTNRSRFLRGEVDKYTWTDVGSSYVLSDLLAGFLYGQLEAREKIQRLRRQAFERYDRTMAPWIPAAGAGALSCPGDCEHPFHMYYLRLPGRQARDWFINALRADGILAVSHYVPLHLSRMGARFGSPATLPVTERVSDEIVRLPFFTAIRPDDQ